MRRRFLALAAVVGILAGCSGSGHHSGTPPTSASRQTAASPNPDVIPPEITPAYVNAVFDVLNHINGNAVRALLAAGSVTPTVQQDLRAIYSPPLYSVELNVFQNGLTQGRSNLRRPVGDRRTTVSRLLAAVPSCIFVETTSDLSAVELRPTAHAASEYWELQRKAASQDPQGLNPTPWSLSYNQDYSSPTSVPDPC